MQRQQAFKYELRPHGEQQRQMQRFVGCCRFVFNKALALQKERHGQGQSKLSYADMCRQLTQWRHDKDTLWLALAPSQALQQSVKDLERAYTNFFAKRAASPKFKKKYQPGSFRYPEPKQIKLDQSNGRIFLPKLGWMKLRLSRPVLGDIKQVTVSQSSGKWFVSIQTAREVEKPILSSNTAVGIDMGVVRFATLSEGSHVEPLNSFTKHEQRLKKTQQSLSRKVKHSNNWKKEKAKLQRLHTRIANARKDFLHKETTTLSKTHALVVVEDLSIRKMNKSTGGKAKRSLNKRILDQGWFEFRRQLEYKLPWNGGRCLAVAAAYTSQTCPRCEHIDRLNRQTQDVFACMQCAYTQHADVVAAMNIVRAGYARLEACGEDVSHLECLTHPLCRLVEAGTHRGDPTQTSGGTVGIPVL